MSMAPRRLAIRLTTHTPLDHTLLTHPEVGMVILFQEHFHSSMQLRKLTDDIKTINPHLLIAVDHEGAIWRFFDELYFPIPPTFREIGEYELNTAKEMAYQSACTIAKPLRTHGIDLTFAPVLDRHEAHSAIIGQRGRAFSHDDCTIAALGEAFCQGLHAHGFPAIGKHFPDHGVVTLDSHLTLPTDSRDERSIVNSIQRYHQLMPQLDAIMLAHIRYPAVDDEIATFSSHWVEVLRKDFGFNGVIFSDCLSMKALSHLTPLERLLKAHRTCDYLIFAPPHPEEPLWPLLQAFHTEATINREGNARRAAFVSAFGAR